MSGVVAVAALRVLGHHAGRMRRAVTVLALGHRLVFFLVAEGA